MYGAAGPTTFDCSGLVYYACNRVGITSCPRTSEEQFVWTKRVEIPLPGDLVFFQGAELDPPPGHVGVVIAPGLMIDAPHTGTVVQQGSFGVNGTGVDRFMGYGRIPGIEGTGTANQALITKKPSSSEKLVGEGIGYAVMIFILLLVVGILIVVGLLIASRF